MFDITNPYAEQSFLLQNIFHYCSLLTWWNKNCIVQSLFQPHVSCQGKKKIRAGVYKSWARSTSTWELHKCWSIVTWWAHMLERTRSWVEPEAGFKICNTKCRVTTDMLNIKDVFHKSKFVLLPASLCGMVIKCRNLFCSSCLWTYNDMLEGAYVKATLPSHTNQRLLSLWLIVSEH